MISGEHYNQALVVSPADPQTVFFGGLGIYQSGDGGGTWNFLVSGGGAHTDQHAFIATGNTLLAGNDGGVYSLAAGTTAAGTAAAGTWASLNNTISAGQIQGLGPHPTDPNKLIAGFQHNGTQLFIGSPGWNMVDTGDGGFALFDHVNPQFAYHTYATTTAGPAIATSSDGAMTWNFKMDLRAHWTPCLPLNPMSLAFILRLRAIPRSRSASSWALITSMFPPTG